MAYPHETDDAGVVIRKNVNADNQAGDPVEAESVTGRANDLPIGGKAPGNSTFGERAKAAAKTAKAVDADKGDVEDKSVRRASRKSSS